MLLLAALACLSAWRSVASCSLLLECCTGLLLNYMQMTHKLLIIDLQADRQLRRRERQQSQAPSKMAKADHKQVKVAPQTEQPAAVQVCHDNAACMLILLRKGVVLLISCCWVCATHSGQHTTFTVVSPCVTRGC